MKTLPPFSFFRPAPLSLAAFLMLSCRAAAQLTVTTLADENDTPAGAMTSLREAVRDAADGSQITLAPALAGGAIVLTSGQLVITGKSLTIDAPRLVIDARRVGRIFVIDTGAALHLKGLTLQRGGALGNGGAIQNSGTLTLTDCVLYDNHAGDGAAGTPGAPGTPGLDPIARNGKNGEPGSTGSDGGAIFNSGTITATRCWFTENAAGSGGAGGNGGHAVQQTGFEDGGVGGTGGNAGHGGAIKSSGTLQLTDCVFDSNSAGAGGNGGLLGIPDPSRGSNGGDSGDGAAIHQNGNMTAVRCTFMSNRCFGGGRRFRAFSFSIGSGGQAGSGTAVFWGGTSATAAFTNCTLTGNTTGDSGRGSALGAAIAGGGDSNSQLLLVHCTVTGNTATRGFHSGAWESPSDWYDSQVGGIGASPVRCENCIVSGNTVSLSSGGSTEVNFYGGASPVLVPFSSPGTSPGVDQKLSAPVITDGSLPVLVPGATAPALNAGAILGSPPATDQRGLPRAVGAPDLGSVEVQSSESPPRVPQKISFSPPLLASSSSITLDATAGAGLTVAFEVASGPATLNGNILTFTGTGFAAVRASQAGDATRAPALPVVRIIETPHTIAFTPQTNYPVFPPLSTGVILPEFTSGGLPVAWSFAGTPPAGFSLTANQLTAFAAGTVIVRGESAANAQYTALDMVWGLTFVQGSVWWDTPSAPGGGPPWFTLVEGSPYGLTITARTAAPNSILVPVPALPGGLVATPAVILPGQTSVTCLVTLPPNPQFTSQKLDLATGQSGSTPISLFLANRANVPLDVFAPTRVFAGAAVSVDVSCPGMPVPGNYGPPVNLGLRTFTVHAVDFDNPSVPIPVVLNSSTTGSGVYPRKTLNVSFPQGNGRIKLTVSTDDGITGNAGPIQLLGDTNADGDAISDIVEAALQRAPNQHHQPPLTIERDAAGLHAVLASLPLNLQGWSVIIEVSTDLQTWTPAPAGATATTPNPDGTTARVSVLLPADQMHSFVRLTATLPP